MQGSIDLVAAGKLGARKSEGEIAELAGHDDGPVDRHVIEVLGGKSLQDLSEPRPRAAATIGERARPVCRDAFRMEKPVEQPLRGEIIIEKLGIGERGGKRGCAGPRRSYPSG